MWCAPTFTLDSGGPDVSRRNFQGIDNAFVLDNVLSRDECVRVIAMAEAMSLKRTTGDEKERKNGALSWVLHHELGEQLIRRIAPCLPLTVVVHSPETPVPDIDDALGPLNGIPVWVREVTGAPEGTYTLDALSARCRVYRYDSGTSDAFLPHHDEVWPGSRLSLAGNEEPTLSYDAWRYNSAASGSWSWSPGDRVSHLSVLLYLNDDFGGGETMLYPGAGDAMPQGQPGVAVTPVSGTALCFGQSFKLGRTGVAHSHDSMLHEGRPVTSLPDRPLMMLESPKYILRADVCYTMPPPAKQQPYLDQKTGIDPDRGTTIDPRAPQQMQVELSTDPEIRYKQLALLKEYGFDISQFE